MTEPRDGATGEPGGRGVFKTALAHRDFRLLLSGMAVSGMGDWLYVAALTAFVIDQTHSARWVAAVTILRFLPHLLLGPLGGVVADRYPRRSVMLGSDAIRAALMLVLAAVTAASGSITIPLVVSFLATSASVPYYPAVAAMTPSIVGERDLAAANSTLRAVDHLTVAVGPALGSILLVLGSTPLAFAVNGLTFVASALFVSRLSPTAVATQQKSEDASVGKQLVEGLRAVTSSGGVSVLIGPFAAVAFTIGQAFVLLPLVSERVISTGSEGVGFLFAAVGVGGIVAAGLTGRLAQAPRPGLILLTAVGTSGTALVLMGQTSVPAVAYVLMSLAGAGNIVLNVVAMTLLQRVLEPRLIGRVFGILNAIAVASLALGSLTAPVIVEAFGVQTALVIAGVTILAVSIPASAKINALDTRSASLRREIAPRVALLDTLSIFDGAPRQALEALARTLKEETVVRGSKVVREGDAADDFFVVRSGTFDVTSAGEKRKRARKVSSLGPGDYFGEIGLIEQIPRTATVTATSDATLYRVDGQDFLDAVTNTPSLSAAVMEGAFGRLARTHPSRVADKGLQKV